jgi:uncharacterized Zn finger protein
MKINKLRDTLISQIEKIEKGEISLDKAREISRTSQVIIDTVRVELTYSKNIKSKKSVSFLDYE